MLLKSSVYMGNICFCGLQVAELRCSRASVFVETVALHIDVAHRAIPLKPSVYLGNPRSFRFDSLLYGFSFCGESVALRIVFAHRAILLKPSVYLEIPGSFHFDSWLYGFSFCGECRISYRFCTSGHPLET